MDAGDLDPMMGGEDMDPMMDEEKMDEDEEDKMMHHKHEGHDYEGDSGISTLTEQDLEYDMIQKRVTEYGCCFQFNLFLIAMTTGLLQGYQIGIIAGTELFFGQECESVNVDEYHEHQADADNVSTQEREFFVSLFSLGAAFGALFGCYFSDWCGRKYNVILGDVFIGIGFLIIIFFSSTIQAGFVGRFVSGLGQGILSFAVPLYLCEIGTKSYNKILGACFTLFTGGGMILGLNLSIPFHDHWKQLYIYGIIPIVALILFILFCPESQNWLINNGRDEEALEVLRRGLEDDQAQLELKKLKYERRFFMSTDMSYCEKMGQLFTIYYWPFIISMTLTSFAQLVGTSSFLYYGPEIIKNTQATVMGVINPDESADILDNFIICAFVLGNLISAFIIYRLGRKLIVLSALPVAITTAFALSYCMYESNYGDDDEPNEEIKEEYRHFDREIFFGLIVIYMLSISIGLSATIWNINSEIMPSYLLSHASGFTATWGWLVNFAVNSVFLNILDDPTGKWTLFIILGVFGLLAFLFVLFFVPETVGKTTKQNLEELIGKDKLREERKRLRQEFHIKDVDANCTSGVIKDDVKEQQEPYRFQQQY